LNFQYGQIGLVHTCPRIGTFVGIEDHFEKHHGKGEGEGTRKMKLRNASD
jgi:hypothetical protein